MPTDEQQTKTDEQRKKAAEGRRWTITVAGTLLWIGIGNAVLHIEPIGAVYFIALVLAVLLFALLKPRS